MVSVAVRLERPYFLSLGAHVTTKFGIPYADDTRYTRFHLNIHAII